LLEVEVKLIVLNILIASDCTLSWGSASQADTNVVFTHSAYSATTKMLCHSLSNCRLLSNTEYLGRRHAVSPKSRIVERALLPKVKTRINVKMPLAEPGDTFECLCRCFIFGLDCLWQAMDR
jgi:hypothetical protein